MKSIKLPAIYTIRKAAVVPPSHHGPHSPLHPERRNVRRATGQVFQETYHVGEHLPRKKPPESKGPGADLTMISMMQRFATEEAARAYMEQIRWPTGPACPHCGQAHPHAITPNKEHRVRPGLYQCSACRKQFTVTSGTVMENTRIPLNKWLLAFYMMMASKTQVSALQLQRQLEIGQYRTAHFLCHRIRYALADLAPEYKLAGTVEADETYIGGKVKGKGRGYLGNKTPVVSVVERGGDVRSRVVDKVTGNVVQRLLDEYVDPSAHLNTDEAAVYTKPGKSFASHETVNHKQEEWARTDPKSGRKVTTNTAEGYFGNTKRSISGTHHAISPQHTDLYMSELDYKYNTRKVTDGERMVTALPLAVGKRLTRAELYAKGKREAEKARRNEEGISKGVEAMAKDDDELRMPATDFDAMMRKVLQTPAKRKPRPVVTVRTIPVKKEGER